MNPDHDIGRWLIIVILIDLIIFIIMQQNKHDPNDQGHTKQQREGSYRIAAIAAVLFAIFLFVMFLLSQAGLLPTE